MKVVPVLKTERLVLRNIAEEDTKSIVGLRSNPNVYQYFVFPHRITEEEHLNWLKNNYLCNENRIDWIAFDDANNLVGVFGVKRETKDSKEAEVSYILEPAQYGKGYASEVVHQLIHFCKEAWKCISVIAEIHEDNIISIKFAEKLGFLRKEKKGLFIVYRKYI